MRFQSKYWTKCSSASPEPIRFTGWSKTGVTVFMGGRSATIRLRAQPVMPVQQHYAVKPDPERRRAEESSEGQLIGGRVLAREPDVAKAHQGAQQRAGNQRQQRALQTQERSDHRHHFHVAETQAFAVADLVVQ